MQLFGSLTIKNKDAVVDSKIAFGNIFFASPTASLDVQVPFTFSSAQGIKALGNSGLLSVDGGGAMTVTGAAKRLDVTINVGGTGGAGTLTFVDLASNVAMKSGVYLNVYQNGTADFAQAANSNTGGGLTTTGIYDSGLIERTGRDTATLGINAPILILFGGTLKLDAGTSVSTTAVNVYKGLVELVAGSSLTTAQGVFLNTTSSQMFADGQAAANTTSSLTGNLTVNSGRVGIGVGEGQGFFTTLNVFGAFDMNGGTLYMGILSGAGNNNKCDTIAASGTTLAAAATLSVSVQNGVQPVGGNSYQLVSMLANVGPGFGTILTTNVSVPPRVDLHDRGLQLHHLHPGGRGRCRRRGRRPRRRLHRRRRVSGR